MAQHKWHKEIKAWADGAKIEMHKGLNDDIWDDEPYPDWNHSSLIYRIKPQPKEPQYLYVFLDKGVTNRVSINSAIRYHNEILAGKIKLEVDDGN